MQPPTRDVSPRLKPKVEVRAMSAMEKKLAARKAAKEKDKAHAEQAAKAAAGAVGGREFSPIFSDEDGSGGPKSSFAGCLPGFGRSGGSN